jgi:hypothetical protein
MMFSYKNWATTLEISSDLPHTNLKQFIVKFGRVLTSVVGLLYRPAPGINTGIKDPTRLV